MPSQKPTDLHTSLIPFKKHQDKAYLHFGLIKAGNFNPIPIDRVNKLFSNNIIRTYKCYTKTAKKHDYNLPSSQVSIVLPFWGPQDNLIKPYIFIYYILFSVSRDLYA